MVTCGTVAALAASYWAALGLLVGDSDASWGEGCVTVVCGWWRRAAGFPAAWQRGLHGMVGLAGPVWAWCVHVVESVQLSRWRAVEAIPSRMAALLLHMFSLSQLSSFRPRVGDRSETARMIAKIVEAQEGGWQVGWSTPDRLGWWFFGGWEKSLSACSAPTWWRLRVSSFLPKGSWVYPFPTPLRVLGETLELVQETTSSLLLSLLKVLHGRRRFEVLGAWWDFSGGRNGCGSFLFSRFAGVGICFCFLSLVLFLWVCFVVAPTNLLYHVVGCYIIYSGWKPLSRDPNPPSEQRGSDIRLLQDS
jgi:hypothetical protein